MNDRMRVRVEIDDVQLGVICKFEIFDDQGLLLLGSGQAFTESVRDQIRSREISVINVHPDDALALTGEFRQSSSRKPTSDESLTLSERRVDRRAESYSSKRAQRFGKLLNDTLGSISKIGEQLDELTADEAAELCKAPRRIAEILLEDCDQCIAALDEIDDQALARRCIRMSVLAMNVSLEMNLDDVEVTNVGTAGLLHDMGLYKLAERFRKPDATRTSDDEWEFRKHPKIARDTFSEYSFIPEEVRVIIGQVHERYDGTGYPRGARGESIHPLARILNVVDSYIALTEPGPGRPPVHPHDAIAFLLHEGAKGRLELSPMQALLMTLTLFPIGSHVELDDGREAKVIRRDGPHYARPIVLAKSQQETERIVLAGTQHAIVRPIVDTSKREMRILPDMMDSLSLEEL